MANRARTPSLVLAAAASLIASTTTDAAEVCVNPRVAACASTIQAGVDAAGPGDTVTVAAGLYFENVRVRPGKAQLRLIGAGRGLTILDPDAPNAGIGIRIESSRVEVAALGIRNGRQQGISVGGATEGVHIHDVRLVGGRGTAAIEVDSGSLAPRIVDNEVRAAGGAGINVGDSNHRAVVRGNVVEQSDWGIVVRGDDVEVSANRVSRTNTYGVLVQGTRPLIQNNVIESIVGLSATARSLVVTGADPVVRGNRMENTGTVFIFCVPCTGGRVADNVSVGAIGNSNDLPPWPGDAFDIRAEGGPGGLIVSGNQVSRARRAAFRIEGVGITVMRNVAADTGTFFMGDGFIVRGGPHTLRANTARNTAKSGFRVDGSNVTLEQNVATDAGLNGFTVGQQGPSTANVLRGNQAQSANAAGFAIEGGAVGTVLAANQGSGNRYDFCDDGAGTSTGAGNRFETTSTVCDVRE